MTPTADVRTFRVIALSLVAALATLLGSLSVHPAEAAPALRIWTGAGGNNSWTNAANWDSGAPVAGDALWFPQDAARKANSNDYPNFTSFLSISFFGSGYTVSGNRVVVTDQVLNVPEGGTNTISLIIDGAADLHHGGGTLNLLGANSYAGATSVNGGTLNGGHNNAFGETSSLVDVFAGTVSVAAGVTIFNPLLVGGAPAPVIRGLAGAEWRGPIEVAGDTAFEAGPGATFELSGSIEGDSGFAKIGLGTVVLSEVNTFEGAVQVLAGTLQVTRDEAFGSANAGVRVSPGATLALNGANATVEPIEIVGGGFASLGALRSMQAIIHVGNLTAAGDATIRVDAGILRLTDGLDHELGANFVTKTGAGMLEVEGQGSFDRILEVDGGELSIRGTIAGDVELNAGRVTGEGRIDGRLDIIGGRLEPGVFGLGTLHVGGITYLGPQGTVRFTVDSAAAHSQLWAFGTVILNGGGVEFGGDGIVAAGETITLIRNNSVAPVNGFFPGFPEDTSVSIDGHDFRLRYTGGDAPANDVVLDSLEGLAPSNTTVEILPPTPILPSGGESEFRYLAFNDSDGPVPNAEIRIPIREGAIFKSLVAEPGWQCVTPPVGQAGTVICTIPSWQPTGLVDFAIFILRVTVVGEEGDSLFVDVLLTHDGVEADPEDNLDSWSIPIGSSDPRPFKLRVPGVARDGSN